MLFKCKYVNDVPTVIPLANMSDNITDDASQVTITDTHGISGSVGAVTDLQTLTNTGSQKAMNNLAELVNDATSPKNYAVGDHILRNGQYSKVKQAIQQGGSFTSSNLEAACIGDEISSISSDLTNDVYPNLLTSGLFLNKTGDDCNNLPIGSMAYAYVVTGNTPFSDKSSLVLTFGASNAYKAQIAIKYDTTPTMKFRIFNGSTWTSWT